MLYIGFEPESTLIVAIIISQVCLAARLWFLKSMVKLPVMQFIKEVYLKAIIVTILSATLPMICYLFITPSFTRFILVSCTSVITSAVCIYYIGCNKNEKKKIVNSIVKIKKKILHK